MKIYRWAVREVVNHMPRDNAVEEPKEATDSKEATKEELEVIVSSRDAENIIEYFVNN